MTSTVVAVRGSRGSCLPGLFGTISPLVISVLEEKRYTVMVLLCQIAPCSSPVAVFLVHRVRVIIRREKISRIDIYALELPEEISIAASVVLNRSPTVKALRGSCSVSINESELIGEDAFSLDSYAFSGGGQAWPEPLRLSH
jgi:hypothetical protein